MKSNLSNCSRGRLYALTSLACLIWLITSLIDFSKDGTIFQWSSIFFAVCIILVIILTAWQSISYFRADTVSDQKPDDEDQKTETTETTEIKEQHNNENH